jgi:hypothetical protein
MMQVAHAPKSQTADILRRPCRSPYYPVFVSKNYLPISLHDPCVAQGTPNRHGVPVYHISRIPLLITITRIPILTVLGQHSIGSRKSWATIFLPTTYDTTFRMEYYCVCTFINCLFIPPYLSPHF